MISEETAAFLQSCLRDIPPTGFIDDQRFTETELEAIATDISEDNIRWQRFFTVSSISGKDEDEEDDYFLDREVIADEWAETIRRKPWFDSADEPEWNEEYQCIVTALSHGRGKIEFQLYFHGQRVQTANPDPVAGVFPVWFVEPADGEDREFVFGWFEFLADDFWSRLRTRLVEFQQPLSIDICRLDSNALNDNEEGVEDYIRSIAEKQGLEVVEHPETERNCLEAEDSLKLERTRFGIKLSDGSHLLVCDCKISEGNTLHLHRVSNGNPVTVNGNDEAEGLKDKARTKISRYNDLIADRKNVQQFVKIIAGVAVISLIHAAIELASAFGVELTTEGTLGLLVTGISVAVPLIAFVVIVYSIWPIVALRRFSWT